MEFIKHGHLSGSDSYNNMLMVAYGKCRMQYSWRLIKAPTVGISWLSILIIFTLLSLTSLLILWNCNTKLVEYPFNVCRCLDSRSYVMFCLIVLYYDDLKSLQCVYVHTVCEFTCVRMAACVHPPVCYGDRKQCCHCTSMENNTQ